MNVIGVLLRDDDYAYRVQLQMVHGKPPAVATMVNVLDVYL